MITLVEITVSCHEGCKADEYPESFTLGYETFEVSEVRDRWYQGYSDPAYPASDYFKVALKDGPEHILKHDLETGKWYLCRGN